ncbi:ABC transporter permease subunit [Salinisphaera orenii]
MHRLLSGDYPRSAVLSTLVVVIVLALAFAPFLFPGPLAYRTYSSICLFTMLVLSYDILLGYTRIISFAHAMFYGIGAYAMAIALRDIGPNWTAMAVGMTAGLTTALAVAFVIALFSLRVRAVFFALVTLAVAVGFMTLVSKLYTFTGGEDGIAFQVPFVLGPGYTFTESPVPGFDLVGFLGSGDLAGSVFDVRTSGALLVYYVLFVAAIGVFLALLRMMNSPFGRVCQAIRENEFRAEALGYRTVVFRTINVCISAMIAAFAGALAAVSLRYISPDAVLSFDLMVNILLMTVIGGMGTLYGAIVGTTLFVLAETYLQSLLALAHDASAPLPLLAAMLDPERWYLWLGVLFVLSVYFFPRGIVGQLRARARRRAHRRATTDAANPPQNPSETPG